MAMQLKYDAGTMPKDASTAHQVSHLFASIFRVFAIYDPAVALALYLYDPAWTRPYQGHSLSCLKIALLDPQQRFRLESPYPILGKPEYSFFNATEGKARNSNKPWNKMQSVNQ